MTTKTTNKLAANRCEWCNRPLQDTSAQYGWRCAQLLGIHNTLDNASDSTWQNVMDGIAHAKRNIDKHPMREDIERLDAPAYYDAVIKYYLNLDKDGKTINDSLNYMNAVMDGKGEKYDPLALNEAIAQADGKSINMLYAIEPETQPTIGNGYSESESITKNQPTTESSTQPTIGLNPENVPKIPKDPDAEEFGKGSYAYDYINKLKKNGASPEEIERARSEARKHLSNTKLEGLPATLFDKDKVQGIWTSPINAKQKLAGYANLFDAVFNMFVRDECSSKVEFNANGKVYRIEFWKADYVAKIGPIPIELFGANMGSGGEIGFYSKSNLTDIDKSVQGSFDAVSEKDYLQMSFSLYDTNDGMDNKKLIFTRTPQEHWWLTGFKPDVHIKGDNLYMVGTITFPDSKMAESFYKSYDSMSEKNRNGLELRCSTTNTNTFYFTFM